MELVQFLTEGKNALFKKDFSSESLHLVIGNETCDLDSAVCSVLYAFYLHQTSGSSSCLCVPLMNIHSEDYVLRTEVTHVFNKYGILGEHLLFIDEIDLKILQGKTRISVTLIDHHVMSQSIVELKEFVMHVIDHRPQAVEYSSRVIMDLELVGSCATLVAEKMLNNKNFKMTQEVAWMLCATILVDTLCLSEQAGRKTKKDEAYVQALESHLPDKLDREACFKELFRAKEDVSALSTRDLLRKDLKVIASTQTSIAMSSVLMNLRVFLQRSHLDTELQQFAEQQNVESVVLMTLNLNSSTGDAERQIAIFSLSDNIRTKLTSVLETCKEPDLQLIPLPTDLPRLTAFDQGNIPASRKKVLPILQAAIAS